ncbi:hypothetical protein [Bradyrhizobium sp. BRP22]|uniref:hypothetical protein n=1 Tax=Bradyrhizobium sp. BRP22 TaxID=2793821 RepID=UPI00201C6D6D|nr:hypothetical protein [Bradyrhizobium sp. BRP22]
MDKLDSLVTERLADQLLTPERVAELLSGLMERRAARDEDYSSRLTALRAKLSDAEGRLGRLYSAIESGIADPSDPTLKDRVAAVKTERDIAQVAFDRAVAEMRPETRITEERIAAFTEAMRTSIMTGETPFRRAYIRSVVDQVEVDDTEIRIVGRRTVLERLVMGGGAAPAGVPSFVRKWRTPTRFERVTSACGRPQNASPPIVHRSQLIVVLRQRPRLPRKGGAAIWYFARFLQS